MIGIFDSGFGGLTILKEVLNKLPNYNYIYLGDSARVPYGNKSQEEIYNYTREAVDFLFSKGCNLIIFACNTVSAQALRKIQQEYLPNKYPGKNVLGVVRPLAEKISEDGFKNVGVIGTEATINSHVYRTELEHLNKDIKVIEKATPLLVPTIEEGKVNEKETELILEEYLKDLKENNIESLVLACTHYPILRDKIQSIMGDKCLVYNPGEIVADKLANYLKKHQELNIKDSSDNKIQFYITGDVDKFKEFGERFLDKTIENIEKVEI